MTNDGTAPTWDSGLITLQNTLTNITNQFDYITTTFNTLNTNANTYVTNLSNVNDIISQQITTVNGLIADSSNQDSDITNENNSLLTLETSLIGVSALTTAIQNEDASTTVLENSLAALNIQLVTVNNDILQAQDNITRLSSNINSFGLYKNKIINGNFTVWQRSTAYTGAIPHPGYAYLVADRWMILAGTSVLVVAQQSTGIIEFNQVANALHLSFSGVGVKTLRQYIEGVRTLQGRSCTISFWAVGPAFTLTLTINQLISPTSSINIVTTTFPITETYTQFSYTFNMPVIVNGTTLGTNNSIEINFQSSSNWSMDITNIQLEQGPMSTFEYRPYCMELMLCQRYYETGYAYMLGYAYQNTTPLVNCIFKVNKFIIPTITTTIIDTSSFTNTVVVNQVTNEQISLGCTKNTYSTDGSFNINWTASSELSG